MAVSVPPPRSVTDATRFTSTTLHATSSAAAARLQPQANYASSSSTSPSSSSRFQPPVRSPRPPGGGGGGGAGGGGGSLGPGGETPAQKVARLRAAHLAAKNAKVSSLDRVIGGTRRIFDSAHRITVVSLIGFTAIAGLLTAYTAVDMMRHNRLRKVEFQAAQQQMEADSLAAARLAFMRGEATAEQTAMVEAARARSEQPGGATSAGELFKMPSLLGAPAPVATSTTAATVSSSAETAPAAAAASAAPAESGLVSQALERERANQRRGGPLDRLGLEGSSSSGSDAASAGGAKKSWWQVW